MPNTPTINIKYKYDSEDMQRIATARKWEMQSKPTTEVEAHGNVTISPCANLNEPHDSAANLTVILRNEAANKNHRVTLIPCTLHSSYGTYWVGILLDVNIEGKISQAFYLDSLNPAGEIPVLVAQQFDHVHSDITLNLIPCIPQTDAKSSGPFLIENFIKFVFKYKTDEGITSKSSRLEQLQSLYERDRTYYNIFVKKQDISADMRALFLSVTAMQRNLELLLTPPSGTSPAPVTTSAELTAKFNTVCDEKGRLGLQIRDVVDNKNLTPYLHRPRLHESWIETAKVGLDYAKATRVPVVAGAAAGYWQGGGMVLAQEALMAEGLTAGTLVLFNPIVLAVAACAAGGALVANNRERAIGFELNEISRLYIYSTLKKDDANLISAEQRISNLIIPNNGWLITSMIKWAITSWDQFYFATLLWAQILTKLQKEQAMIIFQTVYDGTRNKTFQAMSLIGQIVLLTEMAEWDNPVSYKAEFRKETLRPLIETLNTQHTDIVKKYFETIKGAFNAFLGTVSMQQIAAMSDEEFAKFSDNVELILHYKDLHCLRYMHIPGISGPIGKVAEVSFVFLQALCHVARQEYYKANQDTQESFADKSQEEAKCAKQKLNECSDLIRALELGAASDTYPLIKAIITEIETYKSGYELRNNVAANVPKEPLLNGRIDQKIYAAFLHCFKLTGIRASSNFPVPAENITNATNTTASNSPTPSIVLQ